MVALSVKVEVYRYLYLNHKKTVQRRCHTVSIVCNRLKQSYALHFLLCAFSFFIAHT